MCFVIAHPQAADNSLNKPKDYHKIYTPFPSYSKHSSHDITVSCNEFCSRVHHDVWENNTVSNTDIDVRHKISQKKNSIKRTCPKFQGLRQYWRHDTIIHQHKSVICMSNLRYFLNWKGHHMLYVAQIKKRREIQHYKRTYTNIRYLYSRIGWTLQPN